jgi:hypothetical protein
MQVISFPFSNGRVNDLLLRDEKNVSSTSGYFLLLWNLDVVHMWTRQNWTHLFYNNRVSKANQGTIRSKVRKRLMKWANYYAWWVGLNHPLDNDLAWRLGLNYHYCTSKVATISMTCCLVLVIMSNALTNIYGFPCNCALAHMVLQLSIHILYPHCFCTGKIIPGLQLLCTVTADTCFPRPTLQNKSIIEIYLLTAQNHTSSDQTL